MTRKSFVLSFSLLSLSLIFVLSACSKTLPPSPEPSASASEPSFKSVLLGTESFYSADIAQSLTFDDINKIFGEDNGFEISVSAFALADLDNDWTDELACALNAGYTELGFLVLHINEGQIYGYSVPYRAMLELKADGTFTFSSGAADSGYGRMSFGSEAYELVPYVYSESSYDEDNNLNVSYFSAGEAIDEVEFYESLTAQGNKPDADWKDFTDENINAL